LKEARRRGTFGRQGEVREEISHEQASSGAVLMGGSVAGEPCDGGDLNTCQAQKFVVLLETLGDDGSHSLLPSLAARP